MASLKEQSEKLFNSGLKYHENGQFQNAIECYTSVIQLNLNKHSKLYLEDVYFNRAFCYAELQNYELALTDFNKVIKLNPKDAEAYISRGFCHSNLKKDDLALDDYSQAIKLNPNYALAYYNRGEIFLKQEKYNFALDDYNESIKIFSLDDYNESIKNHIFAAAYIGRGVCYNSFKLYDLALADYNKVIELNHHHLAEAYTSRGLYYYELNNDKLALADYNKAIELKSDYAKAYANRGVCYDVLLNNYERALTDYNKAIELNLHNASIYNNRGRCHADLKNYKLALNDFDEAIKLSDSSEYKKQLCFVALVVAITAEKYSKAVEYIEQAFEQADSKEQQHKAIYLKSIAELDRKNQDLKKLNTELEEKNKQLGSEIKQKESLQNRMQKLVEQFTHSLGNVIFPDTIYQVAERLKNNPECRKDVLLLHEAYHSEIIIKLQGELLRQRYANTNPEKFRQFIRRCRQLPNNADNKSIEDILDYAASRVTARFLNQHYASLNTIRDKILANKGVDINTLKQKFEDDILLNKSSRPIIWINENLRPVQITELSSLWKKVCILAESHAEALLFGYFSEILFNAFKYADHDKDEFLTLIFDESVINDKTYLACHWKNPVKDNTPLLGTGKGLDAIQEDLKQLNDTENPEQSLLINQQYNQFQVTLFFNKDLLIDDLPILTRKRK